MRTLTVGLRFELSLPRAMTLHSAARQIKHPTHGGIASPTLLARMLLEAECVAPNGVRDLIAAQVKPDYLDIAFHGKTFTRAGRDLCPLLVCMTPALRSAVRVYAVASGVHMADVLRGLIDEYLPVPPHLRKDSA